MTVEEVMTVEEWKRKNPPIQRKPKTNADHIRSMTDEELAKKISGIERFAITCGSPWSPEKWLDWLKQEAT